MKAFLMSNRLNADTRAKLLDELMAIADMQFNGKVVPKRHVLFYVFSE